MATIREIIDHLTGMVLCGTNEDMEVCTLEIDGEFQPIDLDNIDVVECEAEGNIYEFLLVNCQELVDVTPDALGDELDAE